MNAELMRTAEMRMALNEGAALWMQVGSDWREIVQVGVPVFAIGCEYVHIRDVEFPLAVPVNAQVTVHRYEPQTVSG